MVYTVRSIGEKKKNIGYWVMQGIRNVCIEGEPNSVHQWIVRAEYRIKPTRKQKEKFIEKHKVYDVIISYIINGFFIKQL